MCVCVCVHVCETGPRPAPAAAGPVLQVPLIPVNFAQRSLLFFGLIFTSY